MSEDLQITTIKQFAEIAENSSVLWNQILGKEVTHHKYGKGKISGLKGAGIEVWILFENRKTIKFTKTELIQEFNDLMPHVSLTLLKQKEEKDRKQKKEARKIREEELEQKRAQDEQKSIREKEQEKRETTSRKEFSQLKTKYLAKSYHGSSALDPLYPLLLKIDNNEPLDENEIKWLLDEGLSSTLALYCQGRYKITNNLWDLIKASRYWRDAGDPHESLSITNNVNTTDKKLLSAILATRGGAFRDISELYKAKKCAEEAIDLTPNSYYPYNLLGAILYELGKPEEGDKYFKHAVLLGAKELAQDGMRRKAFEKANVLDKRNIAIYLISLDENRFKWAEYYLT